MKFGVLGRCDLQGGSRLLAKCDIQQHWRMPKNIKKIFVMLLFIEALAF